MLQNLENKELILTIKKSNYYITNFSFTISTSEFGHQTYKLEGTLYGSRPHLSNFEECGGEEFIGYSKGESFWGKITHIEVECDISYESYYSEPSQKVTIHFNNFTTGRGRVVNKYNRHGKKIKVYKKE